MVKLACDGELNITSTTTYTHDTNTQTHTRNNIIAQPNKRGYPQSPDTHAICIGTT